MSTELWPTADRDLRLAISDPGAFVKRGRDTDGDYEPLVNWQARAVLASTWLASQKAEVLHEAADYVTAKNWTGPEGTLIHLNHWLNTKAERLEGKP